MSSTNQTMYLFVFLARYQPVDSLEDHVELAARKTVRPVPTVAGGSMQNFFDWFHHNSIDQTHPWLILGKGPSFAKRHSYDLSQFHSLSLNHAVREQPVKVAHMIDYEAIEDSAEAIRRNAEVLVTPWRPHVNFLPSRKNLEELIQTSQILRQMNEQGRLLWYNLNTAHEKHGNSPVVCAEFFSAEAALDLLAQAGVHRIRSLGVDGGKFYSAEFDDLKNNTLLSCGHASFDKQFKGFAKTLMATGVDYSPLDIEAPVRIYVGATEAEMVPCKVLEYSIRKHASISVRVIPLYRANIEIPQPREPSNRPRTPFSFQRFLIPALAGWQGRAIYLDSDMVVFEDIRRLWLLPMEETDLLAVRAPGLGKRRPQFSVMLLNCERLRWNIQAIVQALDSGAWSYEQLMFEMAAAKNIRADIHPRWNSLEHFNRRKTALLHYTDMQKQPWLSRNNRLNHLWTGVLFEALDDGHITLGEIQEHVKLGYLRPSLLNQIEMRIPDSRDLDEKACALDNSFSGARSFTDRQLSIRNRARKVLNRISIHSLRTAKKY